MAPRCAHASSRHARKTPASCRARPCRPPANASAPLRRFFLDGVAHNDAVADEGKRAGCIMEVSDDASGVPALRSCALPSITTPWQVPPSSQRAPGAFPRVPACTPIPMDAPEPPRPAETTPASSRSFLQLYDRIGLVGLSQIGLCRYGLMGYALWCVLICGPPNVVYTGMSVEIPILV